LFAVPIVAVVSFVFGAVVARVLLKPVEAGTVERPDELGKQFAGEYRLIDNQQFTIADFVARRMDTSWSDFFWAYRDKETNLYDTAVMNVFRAVALVTRDPESRSYLEDVSTLRNASRAPSYGDVHSKGWLDRNFTTTLI
jgi:hypothetical protein